MQTFYHFTSIKHLEMIHAAGALLLTDPMLDIDTRRSMGEYPPVLWMLDMPDLGGFSHGIDTPNWPVDKTEIRFTIEPKRAVKWLDWARAQGISYRWLDSVVRIGGGWDAAEHWYISFAKVTRDNWLEIRNMKTQEVLNVAGL